MNQDKKSGSETGHVTAMIPDYVLDLLGREEQRTVSSHVAACRRCQLAVRRERQILFAVRDTFSSATRPDAARLRALRPEMPRSGSTILPLMHKPLAATLLLLLVILGSLALQTRRNESLWSTTAPGVYAATASATNTPTKAATSTATQMAQAGSDQPTPEPLGSPARSSVRAVAAPRPAVAPMSLSPYFRGY